MLPFIEVTQKGTAPLSASIYGGKAAGLSCMANLGLNVPQAFALPVSMCNQYFSEAHDVMAVVAKALDKIPDLESSLWSVRSGAPVSMPGMMDTILNVGITPDSLNKWQGVLGPKALPECLTRLASQYSKVVGKPLPISLKAQLLGAIAAVFKSWNSERAQFYRKMNNIPDDMGTAVVLQRMVFGNLQDSCTGVVFSRNPDSGEAGMSGKFLVGAQGEDVVSGEKDGIPIDQLPAWNPDVYKALRDGVEKLEAAKGDVQDVEFTVEAGKLYFLQTRKAQRSAQAAVRIAVDKIAEGMPAAQALALVSSDQYYRAKLSVIDPKFNGEPYKTGVGACSGVVTGRPVWDTATAIDCRSKGISCILVRHETTPDDIEGMEAANGVLTMTGGDTSHAAVVARGMNRPCVVGLGNDSDFTCLQVSDVVSIDGATGRVWLEAVPVVRGSSKYVAKLDQLIFKHLGAMPIDKHVAGINAVVFDVMERLVGRRDELIADIVDNVKAGRMARLLIQSHPGDDALKSFVSMFSGDLEDAAQKLVNDVYKQLNSDEFERVQVIQTIKTLQQLVLANGGILDLDIFDPAIEKVLKWKGDEGVQFDVPGVPLSGPAMLSKEQAVAKALA